LSDKKGLHKRGKLNPEIERGLMAIPSYKKWWEGERKEKTEPADPKVMIKIIADYDAKHGELPPTRYNDDQGRKVGKWLSDRKGLHKRGKLNPEIQEGLMAIPSYKRLWDVERPSKEKSEPYDPKVMIKIIADYDAENGKLPPWNYDDQGRKVGKWLSKKKGLHKTGKLNPEIQEALMAIPSYKRWWEGERKEKSEAADPKVMIKIIADYDAEHGELPPAKYIDDQGRKVGQWLNNQKKLHKTGKLNPEIEGGLMAIPAYKRWWDGERKEKTEPADPKVMIKIIADYDAENGELPSKSYIDDQGRKVGKWLSDRKGLHKRGKLNPEIQEGLMGIPSYKRWWDQQS